MSDNRTELHTFLQYVFGGEPSDDERICLTLKTPDGWANYPASDRRIRSVAAGEPGPWYFGVCTAAAPTEEAGFRRGREEMRRAFCLVLDDVGTKAAEPPVAPAWKLESSEGNWQYGYLIEPLDVTVPENEAYYEACQRGLAEAGYTDAGACGTYRVMRVPGSLHKTGFRARVEYGDSDEWALDELMAALDVAPAEKQLRRRERAPGVKVALEDVNDPVYDWLVEQGLTTGTVGRKFVEIICPWAGEHTTDGDTAGYTPVGYDPGFDGAFSCLHEHCSGRAKADFLQWVAKQGGPGAERGAEAEPAGAEGTPDIMGLPDLLVTAKGAPAQSQLVTAENVSYVLQRMGLVVRLNMMTGRVELHRGRTDTSPAAQARVEMEVLDMCARLGMRARDVIRENLSVLAEAAPYHPMGEWLQTLPEPAGDPIGALIASVETDNPLWPVYVRKWLIQAVEAVCGWHSRQDKQSIAHVLVLVGGQGVGKSHWFKRLGGAWMKGEAELHLSSSSGKDHQIEALRHPLVELSELDGIFRKADISHLKSFISREEDSIRAPYERRALIKPRMTAFCASVNEAHFLVDDTGSRRFWPVEVESIDWGYQVDLEGIWGQAYALWRAGEGFLLTAREDAERDLRGRRDHYAESDVEEDIREYLWAHLGNDKFEELPMSTLNVLRLLYGRGRPFSNLEKAKAKKVLLDTFGKHRTLEGKQRAWMVPYNPYAEDRNAWPKGAVVRGVDDPE